MQHKGCPPGHVVKQTVITSNLHVHVRLLTPLNHNMYRLIKYVQEKYSFYMYMYLYTCKMYMYYN